MLRPSSPLAQRLEPLAGSLWIFFCLWSLITAVVWSAGVGEAEAGAWLHRVVPSTTDGEVGHRAPLQEVMNLLLALIDPVWIFLAGAVSYLGLAGEVGLPVARRWAAWIFLAALAVAISSAWGQFPLGHLRFTSRFGWRIGPVPFGWPLLWCVVVIGGRALLRSALPRASHLQVAVGTGLLALLTDFNLEPVAWKVRVFWLWPPAGPSLASYATWLLLATLLGYLMRGPSVPTGKVKTVRAGIVLLILNGLCLATHLAGSLRAGR